MRSSVLKLFGLVVLLFSAAICVPTLARAADNKPNIVYIVADDLGWKDVGYHGSDIKTPNIDKLAEDGARLEQFYAQPMCTPTRAALMTGRYPFRYGLQTLVIPSAHTWGLPTDEYLLPQALKDAGYETAIVGKWHLGHADPKYWPRQRGFDYQYGPMLGEIDYFTHEQHGVTDWYLNNKVVRSRATRPPCSATQPSSSSTVTTPRFRSTSTSRSTHRTHLIRRRRNISTSTRTLPTPAAAPMRRALRRWTTRSAVSSRRLNKKACATTPSSSSRAITVAPAMPCLAANRICRKSLSPATTVPIATARARSTKAERACRLW